MTALRDSAAPLSPPFGQRHAAWQAVAALLRHPAFRCTMVGVLLAVSPLAGCARIDPYRRAGMWQPDGVNNLNIAAQVADPQDLVYGRDDTSPNLRTAAAAVTALWAGHGDKPAGVGAGAAPAAAAGGGTP